MPVLCNSFDENKGSGDPGAVCRVPLPLFSEIPCVANACERKRIAQNVHFVSDHIAP